MQKTEKNNRLGKTRDLFKIPREHFMQMSTIKDRNGMDLTEAESIKERWQEYTEEVYKKTFMTQIITMM